MVQKMSTEINSALALEKGKKPKKPTGACTITIYGMDDTCTTGISFDSCAAIAAKFGGVSSWVEGGKCPEKKP